MKKSLKVLLALFATAVVLVGCSVESGGGGTPPPRIQVTATDDVAPAALATVTRYSIMEVTVPGNLEGDLVVFEAEGPGTRSVVVRDATGDIIGGSSSPYYFVPAGAINTLSDFSPEFNTEAVVNSFCIGPCVIVEGSNSPTKYFVEVRTNGESDFFAYASDYGDQGEPQNDTQNPGVNLSFNNTYIGAFETLNDVDYYWATASNDIISITPTGAGFSNNDLVLRVELRDGPLAQWQLVSPSEYSNIEVFVGSEIRVTSAGGYGGDFESSKYTISVNR